MKALSLLQPWASLCVTGHKKIETRSWNTKYRGKLLIHASMGKLYKKLDAGEEIFDHISELQEQSNFPFIPELPFGAIVGMVDLVDTFCFGDEPFEQLQAHDPSPWTPYREGGNDYDSIDECLEWERNIEREMAFGNYDEGRYGWLLSNPIQFKTPIPCKGKLRLWTPMMSMLVRVNEQIKISI